VRLYFLYAALLLEFLSVGALVPVLPFLAKHLGADSFEIASLASIAGAASFISQIVWGRVSDAVGRKPVLILTIIGSGIAAAIAGLAGTLTVLFAARFVAGLMGGNLPVAISIIADETEPRERARFMGYLTALIALGYVLGNALGSIVGGPDRDNFQYGAVAFASFGLSVASALIVIAFVPETRKPFAPPGSRQSPMRLGELIGVGGLLLALQFLLQHAVSGGLDAAMPLYVSDRLDWAAREFGFFMAGVGVVLILLQVVLIGPLTRRLGDGGAMRIAIAVTVVGALVALAPAPPQVGAGGLALMMIGIGLTQPLFHSLISKAAPEGRRGAFVGLVDAVASLGRIVAPLGVGALYQAQGHVAAFAVLAAVAAMVLLLRMTEKAPRAEPATP
jgi:MFS family permease